jgi:hypothetical protein
LNGKGAPPHTGALFDSRRSHAAVKEDWNAVTYTNSEHPLKRRRVGLDHAANAGMHSFAERGLDLYSTPPVATAALLRVECLPRRLWEPAAGRNALTDVLRAHGHTVHTSDIVDYGGLDQIADFLTITEAPAGVEAIVTNPPFKIVNAFVAHALDLVPTVAMLARLAFLESEKRTDILENRGLARVHIFRNRLPMMHRDGWIGPRASSATAFCWCVWEREHRGPATLHRISWS